MSSEEVVQQDPAFADLLTQRAELSAQIHQIEQALRTERDAVLQEIQQRRAALREKEEATEAHAKALDQQLEPARSALRAKLSETEQHLQRAETTVKSLHRTQAELTRVLKQAQGESGTREAADDGQRLAGQWRDQLTAIQQQLPPLEAQLATLRRQRRLYQAELRLLKR